MTKQETKGTMLGQRVGLLVGLAVVGLALLAGVSYGLWCAFLEIPHGALAAVALGAVVLLPVALAVGWKLGHLEARGVLAGLGLGVNSVLGAASSVADVRVNTVRTVREMQGPIMPQAVLPRLIDVTPHRQDEEVIV